MHYRIQGLPIKRACTEAEALALLDLDIGGPNNPDGHIRAELIFDENHIWCEGTWWLKNYSPEKTA